MDKNATHEFQVSSLTEGNVNREKYTGGFSYYL